MSKFSVKLKNKKLLKHLKTMPKVVQSGLVAGINKVATQARNVGVRAITKRYTISTLRLKGRRGGGKKGLKAIEGAIRVTRKATRAHLIATITASQGRVPGLQHYKPGKKTKRGQPVTVRKGNRRIITGGFISPGAGGKGVGLFVGSDIKVVPKKGRYKGRRLTRRSPWTASVQREAGQKMQREFLDRKFGPSPTGMWRRRGRVKARRFARDNIGRIVASEINFRLRKAIARG